MGLGDDSAVLFLRMRLGLVEATAGLAAEGDAALSHGSFSSLFFSVCCFGDEGDSTGVSVSSCAWTFGTLILRAIPNTNGRNLLTITSVCLCSDCASHLPCC